MWSYLHLIIHFTKVWGILFLEAFIFWCKHSPCVLYIRTIFTPVRICLVSPHHPLSILDFLSFLEGELGFVMQFSFWMGGLTGSTGLRIRWPCEFD